MVGWIVFGFIVVVALALDLLVFHRHAHQETLRSATLWSLFWVGLGLSFTVVVYFSRGSEAVAAYLAAFLIEKSLSVDNLFVFLAIFDYFHVLPRYQHRVLFWGIVGALVTRGIFIFAGVALLNTFHWLIYLLGALLLLTGLRLAFKKEEDSHPERNPIVRFASQHLPITTAMEGERFTIRRNGRLCFTPLVLVLIAIETTDVMFAVDSVPAVLAVSTDPFVIYSSNIFAILGLRALYFVLEGFMKLLIYLRPALALILILIGVKMLLADIVHIPTWVSLVVVAAILTLATLLSVAVARRRQIP